MYLAIGGVLVFVLSVASLFFGSNDAGVTEIYRVLRVGPTFSSGNEQLEALHDVIWQLRMPRMMLAVCVGAALAMAGAIAQVWTGNVLADPGILGVNAGAGCAIAVGITFGVSGYSERVVLALFGAAAAAAIVLLVSRVSEDPLTLILVGIGVMLCLQAVMNLLALYSSYTLNAVRMWAVGSTSGRGFDDVALAAAGLFLGSIFAALAAKPMDLLSMGDDSARSLGVNPRTARILAGFAIICLAGSATAAVGLVLFIGFAAPHVSRRFTGPSLTRLLPGCALTGAAVTLVADVLGRFLLQPGELEMSIVLAMVGAPLMIAVVVSGSRANW
ncbi:iron ABC transporter permease [Corynebacterium sp. TAE3-ERU12]|uniref:FecCD family ABC transporter permease n=1 Tax=Corynebacterium sp. TAE3-ERU12 TaxID=2849491 RepID=UPI001C48EAB7|nr:iron ABC transporter permease [Corynebacterium sp. TAE3-ERU12]MBV7294621.1 iron ABC transporter permease [Corynebacterium sp. TAE3-ERU12]